MLFLGEHIEYVQEEDMLIIQQALKKQTKYQKKADPKLIENPKYTTFGQPGLQVPFNRSNATILDYFKLFATSDFYQMISDQTNLYGEQYFQSNPDDKSSSSWIPTATEIQQFLALYFLTGTVQKPQIRLEYRPTSSDFSFQSRYDQKQVPEYLAVSTFR